MTSIHSRPAIRRASRAGSIVLSLLAVATAASARDLPPLDAMSAMPAIATPPAAHFGAGPLANYRGHLQRRLGIPSFLSARRGSVRLSGASLLVVRDPAQIARGYLRSLAAAYRIAPAEVDALPVRGAHRLPNGAAIVQFGNAVGGVEVFRERASVLVDADGALNSIGGYVTGTGATARLDSHALFRRDGIDAVAVVLADFGFVPKQARAALRSAAARDGYEYFSLADRSAGGERLAQPARVKPVFFRVASGLVPAWYVEVHLDTDAGDDDYYAYVVSAKDGALLHRENLTHNDAFSYRVWAESTPPYVPYPGPQGRNGTPHPTATPDGYQAPFIAPNLITLVNALPATSVAADDPWLSPGALQTVGNNVDAYADLDLQDGFTGTDYRASTTALNKFDRTYDVTQAAQASSAQIMAATTHVFYLNNWLHDWYYDDGFDEAAGNAQQDNYGRGGIGGDPIHAEVGNNPARDNANMSTPADGASPRMQMYVFGGQPSAAAITGGGGHVQGTAVASLAAFGPNAFDTGADTAAVYVDDGVGTAHDGCESPFLASVAGKIAVIDRGNCSFKLKVVNAQTAGAAGVVIVNNVVGPPVYLANDGTIVTVVTTPALGLDLGSGQAVEGVLTDGYPVTLQLVRTAAGVDRDGSIDTTIVAHEWGHYISARLAPGLYASGMGAGMGEGFGDFHALLLMAEPEDALIASNADFAGTYAVAPYSSAAFFLLSPTQNYYYGLRRYPYSTDLSKSPLTYKYIEDGIPLPASPPPAANDAAVSSNSEVHNTGEIWAAMMWQCYASLLNDTPRLSFAQAQDRMKRYLIGGYEMQPRAPTFPEARDAILSVMDSQDAADGTDCAAGFAARGLGVGAQSPDRFSEDHAGVVESFVADAAVGQWTGADVSDSGGSCDDDGQLDSLESGVLTVQLYNGGFSAMDAATISVSSPDAFAILPATPLAVPSIAPYSTASIEVPVQLGAVDGIQALTLNYSAADPKLLDSPLDGQAQFGVNADYVPSVSEDFENPLLAWAPMSADFTDPAQLWRREASGPTQHFAFGPDNGLPGLTMLESPTMQVGSGDFTVTFEQAYDFELSDQAYDGGVIEISVNGGGSWMDVKSFGAQLTPDYNGTIFGESGNPLANRPAYVGAASGLVTIAFSNALPQSVKLRFVIGSDGGVGGGGWQIDNLSASGIVNAPFTFRVADPGHCVLNDRVFENGFEVP